MDSLDSALLNEWYLFTGALPCGLSVGTMLLSSLPDILPLSLVNTLLSLLVIGGGDSLGDSSAALVISLSPLAVTLLPLLTRPTLLSVVQLVSVLAVDVV